MKCFYIVTFDPVEEILKWKKKDIKQYCWLTVGQQSADSQPTVDGGELFFTITTSLPAVLIIMLYKVVLTFESVDEMKFDYSVASILSSIFSSCCILCCTYIFY